MFQKYNEDDWKSSCQEVKSRDEVEEKEEPNKNERNDGIRVEKTETKERTNILYKLDRRKNKVGGVSKRRGGKRMKDC